MKYIISEKQYKILTEISKSKGHYTTEPVYNALDYFNRVLKIKEKTSSFKKYFKDKLGFDLNTEKISFSYNVSEYFDYLESSDWSKKFKTKDVVSGFVYFLAERYIKLKESNGIEYFKIVLDDETLFYFFDPAFKIFIGKIALTKDYNFPGKSFHVSVSATDSELIGKGYGSKMYLIVIENVDYLVSDTILFSGAYRMWKHVLPKYVNVWGVREDNENKKVFEIISSSPKLQVRKYDYFVASVHDNIKSIS